MTDLISFFFNFASMQTIYVITFPNLGFLELISKGPLYSINKFTQKTTIENT